MPSEISSLADVHKWKNCWNCGHPEHSSMCRSGDTLNYCHCVKVTSRQRIAESCRQAGGCLDHPADTETPEFCTHPEGEEGECPCAPSCSCCKVEPPPADAETAGDCKSCGDRKDLHHPDTGKCVVSGCRCPETATEPEAPHEHDWSEWGAVYHGGPYQWRRCACGEKEFRPEPEAPKEPACGNCGSTDGTWFDRSICAEPCGSMHDRCSNCGVATGGCPIDDLAKQPPRRPPVAVAYALEDGTPFEIALPGDATVRSEDGVLIVMHSQSPIKGLVQVKPWGDQ